MFLLILARESKKKNPHFIYIIVEMNFDKDIMDNKQNQAYIHTVLESEKEAFAKHVNEVLKNDPDVKNIVPIPYTQIFDAMQDGVIFWYFYYHLAKLSMKL